MASCKVNITLELSEEDLKDILFKVAAVTEARASF